MRSRRPTAPTLDLWPDEADIELPIEETAVPTLTEFLLARIAEDESAAKAAQGKAWTMLRHEGLGDRMADADVNAYARRVTPARVLAECEAKRRIVELHWPGWSDEPDPNGGCVECGVVAKDGWCLTLRILALPYADHPDYREEWKP